MEAIKPLVKGSILRVTFPPFLPQLLTKANPYYDSVSESPVGE